MQIQTSAVHFKADEKLLDFINERLHKLEIFYDRIIGAQVFLKLENHGQVKDKVAEISINVPGEKLFAKSIDRSFEAAADRAVESLRRSLRKYKERRGK
ncbi:MAG: ribosome-associated translation inhibitor RaiA [Bacteroidota bacterium]